MSMHRTKRIGILTSGGDCAGLNPIIRAVTLHATYRYGWTVLGIKQGTDGLMQTPPHFIKLTPENISPDLLRQGGTMLGTTNKGNPFAFPLANGQCLDRTEDVIAGYKYLGLDGLVVIGGDGSFHIIRQIAEKGGLRIVGIPKTIDNDVGATEISVGYDTAVEVATEALDRLQPTAASHSRVMVLEVMGRDAGHIALSAGIAGGADVIVIPEIPYKLEIIRQKIVDLHAAGRNFALVVVAEACHTETGDSVQKLFTDGQVRYGGIGHYLGERIAALTDAETRVTVLGHVQRGGQPSPRDRLIASAFGVAAVDLIADGKFDRMVAWQNRHVVDVPIADAISSYAAIDPSGNLVQTARGLGICFGDEENR